MRARRAVLLLPSCRLGKPRTTGHLPEEEAKIRFAAGRSERTAPPCITTLPSRRRGQASDSAPPSRAVETALLLFPRICFASAREPYIGANNGAFPSSQMAKSPPRRGKAFWSAARFVCRMTLYACRSSSHKTRHAIFVGTLKLSHKAFAAQNLCGSPER